MENQPAHTVRVVTTGIAYQWINTPLAIGLLFGLAGAFFLAIYFIHRIRRKKAILKLHLRAEAYRAASDPNANRNS